MRKICMNGNEKWRQNFYSHNIKVGMKILKQRKGDGEVIIWFKGTILPRKGFYEYTITITMILVDSNGF